MSLFIDKLSVIVYNNKHKNKEKVVYMRGTKECCGTSTDPGHPGPVWRADQNGQIEETLVCRIGRAESRRKPRHGMEC